jgi:hypothetical protein
MKFLTLKKFLHERGSARFAPYRLAAERQSTASLPFGGFFAYAQNDAAQWLGATARATHARVFYTPLSISSA